MTTNMGSADRIIRVIVGLALLSLLLLLDGPARWIGLVGIVPLTTAFIRWCPVYALFGLRTCPRPHRPA